MSYLGETLFSYSIFLVAKIKYSYFTEAFMKQHSLKKGIDGFLFLLKPCADSVAIKQLLIVWIVRKGYKYTYMYICVCIYVYIHIYLYTHVCLLYIYVLIIMPFFHLVVD